MTEEMHTQVREILGAEIDPIFFEVAALIDNKAVGGSKFLPWLLAYKYSAQEVKTLCALPDENWKPELGELCVSQEFADKVGLDLYDIKDFLVRAYLGGEVKPDPVYGPSLQKDRIEWVDLQPNPYWAERLPRAYYECLNLYLATEMQPHMDKTIEAAKAAGKPTATARIIPRYDSVKDFPNLQPTENYKTVLMTRQKLTVQNCPCRFRVEEAHSDMHVCVEANKAATQLINMGASRPYSWKETFDLVQAAGKRHPVLQTGRVGDTIENFSNILCNCDVRYCGIFKNYMRLETPLAASDYVQKSRFRANVNPDICIRCGKCISERCMFKAIKNIYDPVLGKEVYKVEESVCMGCGNCVETCPSGALKMIEVDPPEVLATTLENKLY